MQSNFKVGKRGRLKDPREVMEQLELMDRWTSGRDRKTTIYPSSFKNASQRQTQDMATDEKIPDCRSTGMDEGSDESQRQHR